MHLHHIIPEADGGHDGIDNCIPLCLMCHEEVGSYNERHPIGRKISGDELRKHRDVWFDFVAAHPERLSATQESLFRPQPIDSSTAAVSGWVEPCYETRTLLKSRNEGVEEKEVFHAKIRNRGTTPLFVETIGFTAGEKRYPGLFSYWSPIDKESTNVVAPGHSAVFSFFGFQQSEQVFDVFDGMYLVTGTGHEFVNKEDSLERLLREEFRPRGKNESSNDQPSTS